VGELGVDIMLWSNARFETYAQTRDLPNFITEQAYRQSGVYEVL